MEAMMRDQETWACVDTDNQAAAEDVKVAKPLESRAFGQSTMHRLLVRLEACEWRACQTGPLIHTRMGRGHVFTLFPWPWAS
jgi:hypothetical protein